MTERNPAMVFEHESNEDARLEAFLMEGLVTGGAGHFPRALILG